MDRTIKEKLRAMYPGAAEWQLNSEALRLTFTEMTLSQYRSNGMYDADNIAFQEFGYKNPGEYWIDRLSEPMRPEHFISIMANHLGKRLAADIEPDRSLQSALELARDLGEGFILTHTVWMVQPLEAVKWMLSLPMRRHLVPPSLASFLRGDGAISGKHTLSVVEHEPRKRGRKPDKLESVVIAMRSVVQGGLLSPSALRNSTEKELERKFGASRETIRKARDIALSENVENGISDISPTNDK